MIGRIGRIGPIGPIGPIRANPFYSVEPSTIFL